MCVSQYVEVRFQVVGFHSWPDAPKELLFLRNVHRHTFHFRVRASVKHTDRAIEFTVMKRYLYEVIISHFGPNCAADFGSKSCEMLAQWLHDNAKEYTDEIVEIGVSEDGEFEGILQWHQTVRPG